LAAGEQTAFDTLNNELMDLYDSLDTDGAMMQMINEEKSAVESAKKEAIAMALAAQVEWEKEMKRVEAAEKKAIAAAEAAIKKA